MSLPESWLPSCATEYQMCSPAGQLLELELQDWYLAPPNHPCGSPGFGTLVTGHTLPGPALEVGTLGKGPVLLQADNPSAPSSTPTPSPTHVSVSLCLFVLATSLTLYLIIRRREAESPDPAA